MVENDISETDLLLYAAVLLKPQKDAYNSMK